jgi:chromosomal replication initiation ATPase DnaA
VLSHFGLNERDALVELDIYMKEKMGAVEDVEAIRKAARIGAGSEEFIGMVAPDACKERSTVQNHVSIEQLVGELCNKFNVSFEQLQSPAKSLNLLKTSKIQFHLLEVYNMFFDQV